MLGSQGHHTDDTLGIDVKTILDKVDLTGKARGKLHEQGSRTRMESGTVHYSNGTLNHTGLVLLSVTCLSSALQPVKQGLVSPHAVITKYHDTINLQGLGAAEFIKERSGTQFSCVNAGQRAECFCRA